MFQQNHKKEIKNHISTQRWTGMYYGWMTTTTKNHGSISSKCQWTMANLILQSVDQLSKWVKRSFVANYIFVRALRPNRLEKKPSGWRLLHSKMQLTLGTPFKIYILTLPSCSMIVKLASSYSNRNIVNHLIFGTEIYDIHFTLHNLFT